MKPKFNTGQYVRVDVSGATKTYLIIDINKPHGHYHYELIDPYDSDDVDSFTLPESMISVWFNTHRLNTTIEALTEL